MKSFLARIYNQYILKQMRIGTHDGKFHCDEVLACVMLTKFTKQYQGATIVRSRDPSVWEECNILVDVGGKDEPTRFLDHHQGEFKGTYPGHDVRLSSAGLVYLHFPEIIPNVVNRILEQQKDKLTFKPIQDEAIINKLRLKIYKKFMIYVDAVDNGISTIGT